MTLRTRSRLFINNSSSAQAAAVPVAKMARFLVALAMLLPAAVLADQAETGPQETLPSYFADYQMVLSLSPSDTLNAASPQFPVVPLTGGAGLNATQTTLGAITVHGSLVRVDQSNYNLFNDSSQIAYVSCDPNESNISPSDVLNGLMDSPQHPAAILLYTINSAEMYCSLTGNDLTYQSIWSMVSSEDAWSARNVTAVAAKSTVEASITGNSTGASSSSSASGGNNSAVAMSILYSITGLITLLFLVIIATGAVRAHRHPERYGPRAGYGGRPRQSRARGIARAVLETLPIVKFGDPQPAKGDPDQELESVAGDQRVDSPVPVQNMTSGKAAVAAAQTAPASDTTTNNNKSSDAEVGATPAEKSSPAGDEHLGCTICTEDFTVGEDVRVLPCDHKFHPACIDPWLVNVSGTCPLCRLDLRPQASAGSNSLEVPRTSSAAEGETTVADGTEQQDARQDRRRSRLLDWNRLRHAPVDERIQALRQIREEGRSNTEDTPPNTQHAKLTDRLREKFHIRTRTQG